MSNQQRTRKLGVFITISAVAGGIAGAERIVNEEPRKIIINNIDDLAKIADQIIQQADLGDTNMQLLLATMYLTGRGMRSNVTEGLRYFTMAAEHGNPRAQYLLADLYVRGRLVKKDLRKAIRLVQQAANHGLPEAQLLLGTLYSEGQGVSQNDMEAFSWFKAAAEGGLTEAQYAIGVAYLNGKGVVPDPTLAYAWLRISQNCSKESGRTNARLNAIKQELTAQHLREAEDLISTWQQNHSCR